MSDESTATTKTEFECVEDLELRINGKGWDLTEFDRWLIRYAAAMDHRRKEQWQQVLEWHEQDQQLLKKIDDALFHPETGLVYIRRWFHRTIAFAAVGVSALISFVLTIMTILHYIGVLP